MIVKEFFLAVSWKNEVFFTLKEIILKEITKA